MNTNPISTPSHSAPPSTTTPVGEHSYAPPYPQWVERNIREENSSPAARERARVRGKAGEGILIAILSLFVLGGLPACSKSKSTGESSASASAKTLYRCSMHPWIVSDKPGKCPICHMDLVLVRDNESGPSIPGRATIHMSSEVEQRIGVTVATVEKRDLSTSIHASAQVAYDPQLYSALLEHREALAFLRKGPPGEIARHYRGSADHRALLRTAPASNGALGIPN